MSYAKPVRSGHDVIAISRSGVRFTDPNLAHITERRADLANPSSLRSAFSEADAVIHCAAYYPSLPRPLSQEMALARQLSDNFYRACTGLPLAKIVYVGAAIAIPRREGDAPSNGQDSYGGPPPDKNPYVQVKWLQDALALQYAQAGLPVVLHPGHDLRRVRSRQQHRAFHPRGGKPHHARVRRRKTKCGLRGRCSPRPASRRRGWCSRPTLSLHRHKPNGAQPYRKDRDGDGLSSTEGHPSSYRRHAFRLARIPVSASARTRTQNPRKCHRHHGLGAFLDGEMAEQDLGYLPTVSVEEAICRTFTWFQAQGMIQAR